MAAPTNSGESDIAIGQVDETIYFDFPPSPPYFPPLSLSCFPPSTPYFPPLSPPPCFPPSPPYSPPFSLPQNFRPSSNQSTENPPQDLLRLNEDISDAGTSTFPPSPPPPPFPPSSNTMAVHPPENLLLYEDVSNTCLTTFPPSPPPPFPPLSNSMFVYPRSEQSMGRPPQNLQYEDIIDTSRNLDEDLLPVKVFAAYLMNIFIGTNKLYIGVGQGHALNGTNRLYIGVGQGHSGKWVAKIRIQQKLISVGGQFNCPEDAAVARDVLAFKLKGDKARLNFPEHLEVIKRKAEILQQLPLTAHEENPDEDSDEVEDEDSDSNEMEEAGLTENQLQNLQQSGKLMVVGFMSDNFNENSPENQQHERIIGASWYFYGKSALWKKKVLLYMNDAFNFMSREELMTILMSEDSVRDDFLFIEMRRRDCSKWESKIRLGWNWLSIGTFNAVVLTSEGAIFKLREDKARLSSPKLFLIFGPCPLSPHTYTCHYHSPIIPRLLQLLRTAQRATPEEFFGIEIGGEGTGSPCHRTKIPRLLQLPPTAQRETPDEYFGIEIGGEGTGEGVMEEAHLNFRSSRKEKRKGKDQGGDQRAKKKTLGVRIAITLEDILETKGMRLIDAAKHLEVSITRLRSICREYGIPRWPPCNERKLSRQSLLNETRAVVDQEGIPQLTSHSNQVLTATIYTNSVVEKEILLPQLLPIAQLEKPDVCFDNDEAEAIAIGVEGTGEGVMEEPQLNFGCSRKGKWKEKSPGGDRGQDKTTGVRISISKEDILETKGMRLIDAAKHLEVSQSSLKYACREYGIPRCPPRKLITQSHPTETPALVDQEGIPQSNSDTLPSDQALAATVEKITSVIVKENLPPPFSPTARPERLDEDFGNVEAEAVFSQIPGIELTPRGERRNKKTGGVRIAISLEEILQTKEMLLKDAAKHLKVSKSTLKRACRGYDIPRWPPRGEFKLISQSCPNESPAVVDKEPIPQLNSDTLLPSNQVSTTIDTKSVIVKARFDSGTLKFQLSWPWRTEELEEQVKKRLGHKAENYYINYKDEDNEYILIGCDKDLQDHISSSILLGTNSIEVFLQPNPK